MEIVIKLNEQDLKDNIVVQSLKSLIEQNKTITSNIEVKPTNDTNPTKSKELPLSTQLYNFVQSHCNDSNKTNIKKFYNYYLPKCDGWTGKMDINKLWEQWQNRFKK